MTTANHNALVVVPRNYSPLVDEPALEKQILRRSIRCPVYIGYLLIVMFVMGGIAWASIAPLAAGAVAPGIISPDGSRRTVQHLEGGIIKELKVRDGDQVHAGDPIVVLQDTQASASYELLEEQIRTLSATRARLYAEQKGEGSVNFPRDLADSRDPKVRDIIQGQRSLFEKRRAALSAQKDVLDDRARQCEEQIRALQSEVTSTEHQMGFIAEEIESKNVLFRKKLVTKPDILFLQRTQAALKGERGKYLGSIAEIKQKMSELTTQRISLEADRAEEISTDLEKARAEYADVAERLHASEDILRRTIVVAPVSGKIANLHFKSVGGVIGSGEPILDIVPTDEKLLIDARIMPSDIDVVSVGLSATVHLTAYSSRGLPRVQGFVRSISADSVVDENTGQSYYLARVEIPKEELATLEQGIVLVPGMPAEVLIISSERTMLAYLLEPFMEAFRRGFRET